MKTYGQWLSDQLNEEDDIGGFARGMGDKDGIDISASAGQVYRQAPDTVEIREAFLKSLYHYCQDVERELPYGRFLSEIQLIF